MIDWQHPVCLECARCLYVPMPNSVNGIVYLAWLQGERQARQFHYVSGI